LAPQLKNKQNLEAFFQQQGKQTILVVGHLKIAMI
jgi:hypothetical protein